MITRQLLELKNDRFENLLKNLRLKRDAIWSWNIRYIFTSDTVLFEKKKLKFTVPYFKLKVCVRVELCCSVELEGGSAA